MSPAEEEKWKLTIAGTLAEVKTNQENLHTKLNEYCDAANKRQEKMEHIVIGNGKPGLSEEVRSLKGKWAAIYGLSILLASALLNYGVESLVYSKQVANVRVTTEAERQLTAPTETLETIR